jgi:hypothetical protein
MVAGPCRYFSVSLGVGVVFLVEPTVGTGSASRVQERAVWPTNSSASEKNVASKGEASRPCKGATAAERDARPRLPETAPRRHELKSKVRTGTRDKPAKAFLGKKTEERRRRTES